MDWKKLLGSITESVDEELRLRNAYLAAENHTLRQQISGRVHLMDSDRKALADIGQKLGQKALEEIATIATPNTILAWYLKFVDQKGNSSPQRQSVGRPRIAKEIEDLAVRMARENRSWGYDRIAGALRHVGYTISDQTVGNILKHHGIPPAPERKKTITWREFIRLHMAVLGVTDFFTDEAWVRCGLVIVSLCCFIHFGRHPVDTVSMILPHRMRWRLSRVPQSRAANVYVQRWVRVVKVTALSWLIWCDEGVFPRSQPA
jgi:transposase